MHRVPSSLPVDERQVEWLLAVAFVQIVLGQIGVADKREQSVVPGRMVIAVVAAEPVVVEMGRPFVESGG